MYQSGRWEEANDKVNRILNDENKRKEMIQKGREKVMREHTWDMRVEQLLKEVPALIDQMRELT